MTAIDNIKNKAIEMGACAKSAKATDWRSMAWLLFTPQGREFCEQHNFPDMELWKIIKGECAADEFGVFIDSGEVQTGDLENVALIGATSAELIYSSPKKNHRVVLMHGAEATIKASNYAVVLVVRIGDDCKVNIDNDGTAVIL